MEIANLIVKIIGLIIIAIGVIMIFDARRIIEKWFSFEYKNTSAKTLKALGFIVSIIGGLIVMIKL